MIAISGISRDADRAGPEAATMVGTAGTAGGTEAGARTTRPGRIGRNLGFHLLPTTRSSKTPLGMTRKGTQARQSVVMPERRRTQRRPRRELPKLEQMVQRDAIGSSGTRLRGICTSGTPRRKSSSSHRTLTTPPRRVGSGTLMLTRLGSKAKYIGGMTRRADRFTRKILLARKTLKLDVLLAIAQGVEVAFSTGLTIPQKLYPDVSH